jgi:hypothetical protein
MGLDGSAIEIEVELYQTLWQSLLHKWIQLNLISIFTFSGGEALPRGPNS